MTDPQFDEAKLLYELITKSRHPIEDKLSSIIPLLGFSTSVNDLRARLDRLMRGMPTEDEFIAMAVWMEKCKLAHKLEQEQFPISSSDDYQVPDIFAIFDHKGQEIPVLIEVKTSHDEDFINTKLRFSERLYKKLCNYANLVELPLLVAWKISGHWLLFDIREMEQHESAYHIDWSGAMKADLMFLLLDSVVVIAQPGVSFTLVLEDLGSTGRKTSDGEEHTFKYHSMRFLDADGDPVTKISWPQFILWTFADHREKQNWQNNLLEHTFEVPKEPIGLPSYLLLPLMVFEWRSEDKRPKDWYQVIREEDFGPVSYSQFKQAMDEGIGPFVRYIMKIVPHNRPDFLPTE